ncbi:MAG: hypothetical protein COB42_06765 [Sulfurimonas sp.]|nr:MAG: hypothetical protein COB42_06765 [Sulfurimonas sp.]
MKNLVVMMKNILNTIALVLIMIWFFVALPYGAWVEVLNGSGITSYVHMIFLFAPLPITFGVIVIIHHWFHKKNNKKSLK